MFYFKYLLFLIFFVNIRRWRSDIPTKDETSEAGTLLPNVNAVTLTQNVAMLILMQSGVTYKDY
jgi:hypothetical protein